MLCSEPVCRYIDILELLNVAKQTFLASPKEGRWPVETQVPEGLTLLPPAGPIARAPVGDLNPEPREDFPGICSRMEPGCRFAFRLNLGNSSLISVWDTRSLDIGLLSSYSPIQLTYHPPFSIHLSFLPSWFWLRDDFLPPDLRPLAGMFQHGLIFCPFASHWLSLSALGFSICCLLHSSWGV